MIFAIFIALSSLRLSTASSELNFRAPISIIRPLHDVHATCEEDLEMLCMDFLQEEEIGDKKLRRRLTEESDQVAIASSYSVSVALHFGNKMNEPPIQRAKDSKRWLNYGTEADTCLWNAFDSELTSNKCTSALMYVNDSVDYTVVKDGYITRYSTATVSIPSSAISIAIICYILYKHFTMEEDKDAEEESANESEQTAFIAVPLTVV